MRSFAFLLSRRWLIFALVVALLAWLAWILGEWQFDRLDQRRDQNAQVRANEEAEPVPVAEVMSQDSGPEAGDEWRLVTATGEYDVDNTVTIRYRTREGEPGVDVVVPFVTTTGQVVAVDRGWLPSDNRGGTPDDIPAPPDGEVTLTGWLRVDATGSSAEVADHSARAVSGKEIGEALDLPTYHGFVDLHTEDPEPEQPLMPVELPDLGEGPHFFYGLQWWFFGLLALVGFGWLARDEWRKGRAGDQAPADVDPAGEESDPPLETTVDREHDPGDVARGG